MSEKKATDPKTGEEYAKFEGMEYLPSKIVAMDEATFKKSFAHMYQGDKLAAFHAEATRVHGENTKAVPAKDTAKK